MNHDTVMNNLLLQEQKHKTEQAEIELRMIRMALLPHNYLPVNVTRDGSRWVCTYALGHDDPLQCVSSYGVSPKQACLNFDALWNGEGYVLEGPEVEEEEDEEEF